MNQLRTVRNYFTRNSHVWGTALGLWFTMSSYSTERALKYVGKNGQSMSVKTDAIRFGGFEVEETTTPNLAYTVRHGYLCGLKEGSNNLPWPYTNTIKGASEPAFSGDTDAFIKTNPAQEDRLTKQLKNKVRKCPECGKNVAYTLSKCNGCGSDISHVQTSSTNNVFAGFIYGIAKGPFKFTISLRHEDENFIVFDDPLALSAYHFNCVPTSVILPDWRYLLLKPKAALSMVLEMHRLSSSAVQKFMSDDIRKRSSEHTSGNDLDFGISGFNFPPSQFQLHLQHMHPPFLPFQYYQLLEHNHFTKDRFFPLEYVVAVLALDSPYEVTETTDIRDIISYYKTMGVDYDKVHTTALEKYTRLHREFAEYEANHFHYIAAGHKDILQPTTDSDNKDDTTVHGAGTSSDRVNKLNIDPNDVVADDKKRLQNYGRPYDSNGNPSGTYYSYPKRLDEVRDEL